MIGIRTSTRQVPVNILIQPIHIGQGAEVCTVTLILKQAPHHPYHRNNPRPSREIKRREGGREGVYVCVCVCVCVCVLSLVCWMWKRFHYVTFHLTSTIDTNDSRKLAGRTCTRIRSRMFCLCHGCQVSK